SQGFSRTNWNIRAAIRPRKRQPSRESCCQTFFPNNGRTLTDDVVDVFLPLLTNGKVIGDKVGPHGGLLDEFPYLAPPHAYGSQNGIQTEPGRSSGSMFRILCCQFYIVKTTRNCALPLSMRS